MLTLLWMVFVVDKIIIFDSVVLIVVVKIDSVVC